MIYEYKCKKCNAVKEVFRFVKDFALPEVCCLCGIHMARIYSPPNFKIFRSYYNHGLGIKVSRQDHISDELKRVKDETGNELIEVGNEKVKTKRKAHSYKLTKNEYQQAEQILSN